MNTMNHSPRLAQPELDAILLALPEAEQQRIEAVRVIGDQCAALYEELDRMQRSIAVTESEYVVDLCFEFSREGDGSLRAVSLINVARSITNGIVLRWNSLGPAE
jgi:hypothetical protein